MTAPFPDSTPVSGAPGRLRRLLRWSIRGAITLFLLLSWTNLYWSRPVALYRDPPATLYHDYTGVIHVHSRYSDGSGDLEDLAAAAAETRVDFIMTTDHNTVAPILEGQEGWYGDVLIASGIEVTFHGGHYLYFASREKTRAFDFDNPTGPLEKSDPEELIILAHPVEGSHPITDWDFPGYDGMEVYNGNVEWRDDTWFDILLAVPLAAFFTSPLNVLADRRDATLAVWDSLQQHRVVIGVGGTDAHARIPLSERHYIPLPSYVTAFRFIRTHILLDDPIGNNFFEARAHILDALMSGRHYIEIGDFADPTGFLFQIEMGESAMAYTGTVPMADSLVATIQLPRVPDIHITLYRNGAPVAESQTGSLRYPISTPGLYRTEVAVLRRQLPWFQKQPYPWIVSNVIHIEE